MPRAAASLAVIWVILLGMACTDLVAPPDDFQLPEPDLSLDPERLSVGELIATPCAFGIYGNRLDHLRDKHEWVLVDIFFGRSSPEGPWDGPTATDIGLVTSQAGRVLYQFNVPAVRARILLSRVPELVEQGFWITVRDVPDPTRYDVPSLAVGFNRPLEDADVELYVNLGGRVEYRWDFINALSGILPDRSIPALRDRSDVEYVQASSVACIG
jgi:hypothetical protein